MILLTPPLLGPIRFTSTSSRVDSLSRLLCPFSLQTFLKRSTSTQTRYSSHHQAIRSFSKRNLTPKVFQQSSPRHLGTNKPQHAEASSKFGFLTEGQYQKHPNKFQDLPFDQLKTIFGPTINKNVGNNLLTTLQKQRITGTLDQDIDEPYVTPYLVAHGLHWLRTNYPLDEDAAIIRRIEDENRQFEQDYIADADKHKLWVPQQRAAEEGIYGRSRFEELRKENEGRQTARSKQAVEVRKAHEDTGLTSSAGQRSVLASKTESAEWVKRYKERAALSKMLEPPEMSRTKRLLPSSLFAASVILLCVLFASNYTPPIREARVFSDIPPAAATVLTLVTMNITFFMMWRLPVFWRLMNRNFLLLAATPHPPSLLGNIFSHQEVLHLVANMAILWFVGTRVHDQVGRGNFLAIYVASGVFASWFSLVRLVLAGHLTKATLGCSGAVTALIATLLCLDAFPGREKETPGAPAISGTILAVLILFEFGALFKATNQRNDYFAHLGGYLMGIISAAALTWRSGKQAARRPTHVSKVSHGKNLDNVTSGRPRLSPIEESVIERKA